MGIAAIEDNVFSASSTTSEINSASSSKLSPVAPTTGSSLMVTQEDGPGGENFDSDVEHEPLVTHVEAQRVVQMLQRYFVEQGFSDTLHIALDTCANGVEDKGLDFNETEYLGQFYFVTASRLGPACIFQLRMPSDT